MSLVVAQSIRTIPRRRRGGLFSLACCGALLLCHAAAAQPPSATAPAGSSLFDRLFSRATPAGPVYEVPYPFERLLARLDRQLPPRSPQRQKSYSTALIPHGRSLQRDAARPAFFRYPRIVLALDAQPRARTLVRDRLFIGYQEKAAQLEVISYNRHRGRFEFQVVSDYAAGATPVVRHAPRALCLSCHQNGGAIFARAGWRETNIEPGVASRIAHWHREQYHGVAIASTDAGRIDSATDRANLIPLFLRIWREGCEIAGDADASRRCRAEMFAAMLRYRLGAWSGLMPERRGATGSYRQRLLANWAALWPDGLAVPDADIPDRPAPQAGETIEIAASLDPLRRRPPRTRWHAASHVDRAVKGLADAFLLPADIERLDRSLHRYSTRQVTDDRTRRRVYRGDCDLRQKLDLSANRWINLECLVRHRDGDQGELIAELVADASGTLKPALSWLYFGDHAGTAQAALTGTLKPGPRDRVRTTLGLLKRYELIRARTTDGTAMSSIGLTWPARYSRVPGSARRRASVELTLTPDLHRMADGVAALLRDALDGRFDGFDAVPIQGIALMNALFDRLGIAYPNDGGPGRHSAVGAALAGVPASLPRPRAEPPGRALLRRHCGDCHRDAAAQLPPGFLAGGEPALGVRLRTCAARMDFRLGMWELPPAQRSKTPMPPAAWLAAASIEPQAWRSSEDYRALRQYVRGLNEATGGSRNADYAALPQCLPSAVAARPPSSPALR